MITGEIEVLVKELLKKVLCTDSFMKKFFPTFKESIIPVLCLNFFKYKNVSWVVS